MQDYTSWSMTRKSGIGLLACQGLWTRFLLLCLISVAPLVAQSFEFWPGTVYDSRIPTFVQVLGYEPGGRITTHAGVLRYFEALAAASPRIRIFEYGTTCLRLDRPDSRCVFNELRVERPPCDVSVADV